MTGERKSLEFWKSHKLGAPPEFSLNLFSCSLDEPPKRDDEPSARKSYDLLFEYVSGQLICPQTLKMLGRYGFNSRQQI